jgi:hypothetical protein
MYSLRTWQTLLKTPSILQASTTDGKDRWTEFPIGMSYHWLKYPASLIGNHSETVLCAIGSHTDSGRRKTISRETILKTLETNGIDNTFVSPQQYFHTLPNYKFVISPEGNGIDCHRHYEALISGCIPIMEKNPLTEKKYSGCPILWTTDYSEITESYLQEKYCEMMDQVYDFSCLELSHYPYNLQLEILHNSEYWTNVYVPKKNKLLPFLKI